MLDLESLKRANLTRWQACRVTPGLIHLLDAIACHLVAAKPRYLAVEARTAVPWAVIAVIHQRECSQSWAASLAQGDPWNRISVHEPRGRGPFQCWAEAAEDALIFCPPHAAKWTDWSIAGALTLLERFNGLGYAAMGRASPYLWASTDQYRCGKYIADGHYDPDAIDRQTGCAALLTRMSALDPSIATAWTT